MLTLTNQTIYSLIKQRKEEEFPDSWARGDPQSVTNLVDDEIQLESSS